MSTRLDDRLKSAVQTQTRETTRVLATQITANLLKMHMQKWNREYESRLSMLEQGMVNLGYQVSVLESLVRELNKNSPISLKTIRKANRTGQVFKNGENEAEQEDRTLSTDGLQDESDRSSEGTRTKEHLQLVESTSSSEQDGTTGNGGRA